MRVSLLTLCSVVAIFFSLLSSANENTTSPLNLHLLAKNTYWQLLLHQKKNTWGATSSYINDKQFFLSANGASDSYAELLATLSAFKNYPELQCRFIARRQWLLEELADTQSFFDIHTCNDYDEWRGQLNTDSVVLVFASSYLNSPSSMYGHTFLRFDPPNVNDNSPLLSYALNFGAIVDENDTGMLYAFRGIAGGYPGQFSAQRYYEKVKEYSRFDNRDLWEYQLNFTSAEIDRLLAHVWELNHINFNYYFFDENCSFRLMELLDVARPGHRLSERFPIVSIPIDTVRVVNDAGMIAQRNFRASNGSIQAMQYQTLTAPNRHLAHLLTQKDGLLESDEFLSQSVEQQLAMVDVAYAHLRDNQVTQKRDAVVSRRRYQLLSKRHQLSDYNLAQLQPTIPVPPEQGHDTALWGVAFGEQEGEHFVDIEARIAYHDLLDNVAGYANGSALNMGRIVVRQQDSESLELQQVDFIDITSFTAGNEMQQPLSWLVNSGIKRSYLGGTEDQENSSLRYYVNGGVGKTYAITGHWRAFATLDSQLEYNDLNENNWDIALGVYAGAFVQQDQHALFFGVKQWVFYSEVKRTEISLGYQYAWRKNTGLRISLSREMSGDNGFNEATMGVRQYF